MMLLIGLLILYILVGTILAVAYSMLLKRECAKAKITGMQLVFLYLAVAVITICIWPHILHSEIEDFIEQ